MLLIITLIENDNTFEDIFVEQIKGHFSKGDVLISISSSGNFANVAKEAELENELEKQP